MQTATLLKFFKMFFTRNVMYEGCFGKLSPIARCGGRVTALFKETQKVIWCRTVTLARSGVRLLISCKMTAANTKPTKCEELTVLMCLRAKHFSAEAVHCRICPVFGPVLWLKGYES